MAGLRRAGDLGRTSRENALRRGVERRGRYDGAYRHRPSIDVQRCGLLRRHDRQATSKVALRFRIHGISLNDPRARNWPDDRNRDSGLEFGFEQRLLRSLLLLRAQGCHRSCARRAFYGVEPKPDADFHRHPRTPRVSVSRRSGPRRGHACICCIERNRGVDLDRRRHIHPARAGSSYRAAAQEGARVRHVSPVPPVPGSSQKIDGPLSFHTTRRSFRNALVTADEQTGTLSSPPHQVRVSPPHNPF
jgi:hypothetical protein